jgi:outer membrane protein TolC
MTRSTTAVAIAVALAGLSTTFLVLQAQRDLATSETSELRAHLDYRTALVTFDLVQAAPG